MDSRTYLVESARTASAQFRTDVVPLGLLRARLEQAVDIVKDMDAVKKGLFYGKPLNATDAFVANMHRADTPVLPEGLTEDIIHGVIGIFTEAGEMMEAILKAMDGEPIDLVNLREELGDVEWYKAMLYRALKALPEEVRERNIAKLRRRYPDKFTSENAINRDVVAERRILEGKDAAE